MLGYLIQVDPTETDMLVVKSTLGILVEVTQLSGFNNSAISDAMSVIDAWGLSDHVHDIVMS